MSVELRLYEHPDCRACVEGAHDIEVGAHGWEHAEGDTVEIDGRPHRLVSVSTYINTDDRRGNYIVATAELAES